MLKLFKILMLMILMTAINGQALAIASMSCQMTDSHSHLASMMNMEEKDIHELDHSMHADHDIQNMSQEMDCCKTQCVCPTSGCSQSGLLITFNATYAKYGSNVTNHSKRRSLFRIDSFYCFLNRPFLLNTG